MDTEKSVIKELKTKYNNLDEILIKRYDNDNDILNFYQEYYNEFEKLEQIGFTIWKMFGELWKEEKQSIIIDILSFFLFLEQQILKIKKMIYNITNKNKNQKLQEDKIYLLQLINNNININSRYIEISSSYEEITDIYLKNRQILKDSIEKEYERIIKETI
jgi:hypothetical protein